MTEKKETIAQPDTTRGIVTDIAVGIAAGVGGNLGTDGIKAVGGKIAQQIKGDEKKKS